MVTIPDTRLNDDTAIPLLGLGTYKLNGVDGIEAIVTGLRSGYRLLDSAVNYLNEDAVGEAVRRSGVPRDEIIVTTKLPGRDHGFKETILSAERSLAALGLDRIDLYLIHWPLPRIDRYIDSWRAMIDLRERGDVRSIGVSNFTPAMLDRLIEETGVVPAVNQVELHPYFPQDALRAYHRAHGIATESWSPLARRSELLEEPLIVEIAAALGVSPTRLVLRWHVQSGAIPIPKSADPERQRENADVFDFTIGETHMEAISSLEVGRLWGGDPDTHEEL